MKWLTAALVIACGCEGSGGAVSVRWHIVDLTDGTGFDPRDSADSATGACRGRFHACGGTGEWTVHSVRVIVADPATGVEVMPGDRRLEFKCAAREATTPFVIPPTPSGQTVAVSLQAFDPASGDAEGVTPAPFIRTIRKAEIVNLDVVEIGVRPLPLAPAAASDAGCP